MRAAAHSRISGVIQVIVGPATTLIGPPANAVLGSSSSPTESTFLASWKSAADACSCRLPARSAGAPPGIGNSAIPVSYTHLTLPTKA